MLKNILIAITGLFVGIVSGYLIIPNTPLLSSTESINRLTEISQTLGLQEKNIIGFLPYWLLEKADKDYSPYITTLTYFGLTVEPDGTIQKFTNPGEAEPGWHALNSGKVDSVLENARKDNLDLSLLIFSADEEAIAELVQNPELSAKNLVDEVSPIMKKHKFTDLNIDIESVKDASPEARINFTAFVREVKKNMAKENLGTLTIDVSPTAMLRNYLINVNDVSKIIDYVVFMTYDYHYSGSAVTGAVSPVGGMEKDAEFDTETAIKLAKQIMPEHKIIIGAPLYGYEWETLEDTPRSAIIPGSGQVISNRRLEVELAQCATCSAKLEELSKESYLIYKNQDTGTFQQAFYPDKQATAEKIKLAEKYKVGGIALWALGYEGDTILEPLAEYK